MSGANLSYIFERLNSPNYFTIYPPISQLVFILATSFGIENLNLSMLVFKLVLLCSECGIIIMLIQLLKHFKLSLNYAFIYALNPLVIIETMTNIHFESIMIFTLLLAFYWLVRGKYFLSSWALACSIATKLLPLMFLPVLLIYLIRKKRWLKYALSLSGFLIILFTPFFLTLDISNFLSSVDLYFQKFEFNAGIYYLLRAVGKWLTGYNQIIILGPLLALTTLVLILEKSFGVKKEGLLEVINVCLFSFITYLVFSTTVHPWYLLLPLALSVLKPKVYLIFWSFVIILSYSTYMNPLFNQNLYLIGVEYFSVFLVWILEQRQIISYDKLVGQTD